MKHGRACHASLSYLPYRPQVIKHGSNGTGKPTYACKTCGRQFVDDPAWRSISDEITGIIDRLLLERILLAGIARAVQVSESWLQA